MNPDTEKLVGKLCQKVKGIQNNSWLAENKNVGHLSKELKLPLIGI